MITPDAVLSTSEITSVKYLRSSESLNSPPLTKVVTHWDHRADNGGECVSKEFDAYLKSKGIKHQLTIAYTPEQNGVAECINRTIMESAKALYHTQISQRVSWLKL